MWQDVIYLWVKVKPTPPLRSHGTTSNYGSPHQQQQHVHEIPVSSANGGKDVSRISSQSTHKPNEIMMKPAPVSSKSNSRFQQHRRSSGSAKQGPIQAGSNSAASVVVGKNFPLNGKCHSGGVSTDTYEMSEAECDRENKNKIISRKKQQNFSIAV